MSDETVLEGGCGCGHVRYRVTGEPIFVNNCHCRQCQQQTGGTSVVNAFIESERFELLSGDLCKHTLRAGSGGPHGIVRCAACGIALYSEYPRFAGLGIGFRVGTLDEPGSLTPDAVIYVGEKMPWVTLPDDLPHFDAYYAPSDVLPPDRLSRLSALIARREQMQRA